AARRAKAHPAATRRTHARRSAAPFPRAALLLNNSASILGDRDANPNPAGSWFTIAPFGLPIGVNSEAGPASAPADAEVTFPSATNPSPSNHLHSNPYPKVGAPGQGGTCMAGQETYAAGRLSIGNPATTLGRSNRTTVVTAKPFDAYRTRDTP
ncbi:MAG TPA: hypothetical protein VLK58_07305, partial [Conexibacter sp.]|nr:hypothetical protein [Conexibacter sp.]